MRGGRGGGDLGFPSARHCARAASDRDPELLAAIGLLTHASQVGKTVLRAQAARGLATVAVRSPEPYRLACYGALRASRGASLPCTADAALRVLDGLYEARELARRAVQEEQGGAGGAGGLSDARKRELTELHHALLRRVQCLCPVPETLYRPLGAECSRLLPELAQPPPPGSGPGSDAEGPASAEGGRAGAGAGAGAGRAAGAGAAPEPPFTPDWAASGEWADLGGQDSGAGFDFGSFGDRDEGEGGAFRADAPPDGPPEGPGPGAASPEPPPRGRSWPGMTLQRRPPGSSACAQAPQGMHTTRWRPGRSSRRRRATVWSRRPTSPTPAPRVTPEQRAPACAAWPRLAANPPPNRKVPGGGAAAAVAGERKLRGRPGRLGGCSNERAGE